MLTKRTNLLFDEKLWKTLVTVSREQNASVGELVRQAVRSVYVEQKSDERRKKASMAILSLRKRQTSVDYKALIAYGRKHP